MRAINLKTNHLTAPLGMDAGPLFLSWQCVDGVRQTGYEIELTANGETVWHSGKVQSAAVHADAPTVGGSRVRGCWLLIQQRLLLTLKFPSRLYMFKFCLIEI